MSHCVAESCGKCGGTPNISYSPLIMLPIRKKKPYLEINMLLSIKGSGILEYIFMIGGRPSSQQMTRKLKQRLWTLSTCA